MFQPIWFASLPQLLIFYVIVLATFIYLLGVYRKSSLYILIIILFYPAIFSFVGKGFQDTYRILVLILTLIISFKNQVFSPFKKIDAIFSVFFSIFTISFLMTANNNGDKWTIILSQYSRYLVAYCLWFLVRNEIAKVTKKNIQLIKLIDDIILVQIIINICKLLIFSGRQIEGLVGTISHIGGAHGTIMPVLGFIYIWFSRQGKLNLKDWLVFAGLMLLGFLSGKRAVWFIMPLVISAFLIYIPKVKINRIALFGVLFAPLAFYFGVRLTPSLNPEQKIWGSFNPDFAYNYALKYQFGDKTKSTQNIYHGRGGAFLSLWDRLKSDDKLSKQDLFGLGLRNIYSGDYLGFRNLNLSISNKGSASGVYQSYVATGYIGIFVTILLFFPLFWHINNLRIRWVLLLVVAWEYFLYTGIIFRTPAYMFLVFWYIHYGNKLNEIVFSKKIAIPSMGLITHDAKKNTI